MLLATRRQRARRHTSTPGHSTILRVKVQRVSPMDRSFQGRRGRGSEGLHLAVLCPRRWWHRAVRCVPAVIIDMGLSDQMLIAFNIMAIMSSYWSSNSTAVNCALRDSVKRSRKHCWVNGMRRLIFSKGTRKSGALGSVATRATGRTVITRLAFIARIGCRVANKSYVGGWREATSYQPSGSATSTPR